VNVAATNGHGKLYRDAYSVSPAGIFVPPDSPIQTPADLAGVPISVGFQSGSHYSTIQALEQYLKPDQINLSFSEGLLFHRMAQLIDLKTPAASLFSGPYYFLEQLGFRKVIDSTFMIATLITGDPAADDVRKPCARRARTSICAPICTRTITGRSFPRASTIRWTRAAGARRAHRSNRTRARYSKNPSSGSPSAPSRRGGMGECNYDQATVSVPTAD
jgi:hypothetical protein